MYIFDRVAANMKRWQDAEDKNDGKYQRRRAELESQYKGAALEKALNELDEQRQAARVKLAGKIDADNKAALEKVQGVARGYIGSAGFTADQGALVETVSRNPEAFSKADLDTMAANNAGNYAAMAMIEKAYQAKGLGDSVPDYGRGLMDDMREYTQLVEAIGSASGLERALMVDGLESMGNRLSMRFSACKLACEDDSAQISAEKVPTYAAGMFNSDEEYQFDA